MPPEGLAPWSKGLKMWGRRSGAMPAPVSVTEMRAESALAVALMRTELGRVLMGWLVAWFGQRLVEGVKAGGSCCRWPTLQQQGMQPRAAEASNAPPHKHKLTRSA